MREFSHNTIKSSDLKNRSGVYKIIINKKSYIGSSINLESRLCEHFYDLKNEKHTNSKLLRAWKKYKFGHFEIIELCEKDKLIEREEFYYNIEGYYNLQSPYKTINSQSKKVYQYDLDGKLIAEFYSTGDASRNTGIHQTAISAVCNHEFRTYSGGFLWSYKLEKDIKRITGKANPTYMYGLDGIFIKEFYSCYEAARYLKDSLNLKFEVPGISTAINTSINSNGRIKAYNFLFTNFFKNKINKHKKFKI